MESEKAGTRIDTRYYLNIYIYKAVDKSSFFQKN